VIKIKAPLQWPTKRLLIGIWQTNLGSKVKRVASKINTKPDIQFSLQKPAPNRPLICGLNFISRSKTGQKNIPKQVPNRPLIKPAPNRPLICGLNFISRSNTFMNCHEVLIQRGRDDLESKDALCRLCEEERETDTRAFADWMSRMLELAFHQRLHRFFPISLCDYGMK
jgi:hypothetical protein